MDFTTETIAIPRSPYAMLRLAKDLHEKGWTYRRLAKFFGVSLGTAFNMVNGLPEKQKDRP